MAYDHQHEQRLSTLRIAFLALWLTLLLGVIALLAIGGRPDPVGLGRPLDGAWLFHPGDNPAWAAAHADDRDWDRITLVSRPDVHDFDVGLPGYLDGWRAHGHPDLEGYGWYRRLVAVPQGTDLVLIGPPAVDDGYQMFWDGHPIGGIGRLSGTPRVMGTRPFLAPVPASAHPVTLAIRAYMQPGLDRDMQSGGLRTVPLLAPRAQGEALYRAQWRRTIAGYVVDAVEPFAMLVLAALAAFAAPARLRPGFARWTAFALIASAFSRLGNAISAWTDLLSLPLFLLLTGIIITPLAKLSWVLAWNQWTDGRTRRWTIALAAIAWLPLVAAALTQNPWLPGLGRSLFALAFAAIAIRIAHHGTHRALALAAMALVMVGLFASDLSTLGVPGIWFPFNIGVSRSQYAYALALPLLAWLLASRAPRAS